MWLTAFVRTPDTPHHKQAAPSSHSWSSCQSLSRKPNKIWEYTLNSASFALSKSRCRIFPPSTNFLPPVQNFHLTHKSCRVFGPRINTTTVDGVCTGVAPGTGATSGSPSSCWVTWHLLGVAVIRCRSLITFWFCCWLIAWQQSLSECISFISWRRCTTWDWSSWISCHLAITCCGLLLH